MSLASDVISGPGQLLVVDLGGGGRGLASASGGQRRTHRPIDRRRCA